MIHNELNNRKKIVDQQKNRHSIWVHAYTFNVYHKHWKKYVSFIIGKTHVAGSQNTCLYIYVQEYNHHSQYGVLQ